jgi:hypothetical protein
MLHETIPERGFFYGKTMKKESNKVTNYSFDAQAVLATSIIPFELLDIRPVKDDMRAVVSFPTQGLDPIIGVGLAPKSSTRKVDEQLLFAIKDAIGGTGLGDVQIGGTLIDFTTRNRKVVLVESNGDIWISTRRTFHDAVADGLAAMVTRKSTQSES